jgi:hypothetical protein
MYVRKEELVYCAIVSEKEEGEESHENAERMMKM